MMMIDDELASLKCQFVTRSKSKSFEKMTVYESSLSVALESSSVEVYLFLTDGTKYKTPPVVRKLTYWGQNPSNP